MAKIQVEKGIKIKALSKVPELLPDVIWVWNAFERLSSRRTYGFSTPNPITLSEIWSYCQIADIAKQDELDFMMEMIPRLDDIWMNDWAGKQEKKPERTKPKR